MEVTEFTEDEQKVNDLPEILTRNPNKKVLVYVNGKSKENIEEYLEKIQGFLRFFLTEEIDFNKRYYRNPKYPNVYFWISQF